jgi:hypothetical protein
MEIEFVWLSPLNGVQMEALKPMIEMSKRCDRQREKNQQPCRFEAAHDELSK